MDASITPAGFAPRRRLGLLATLLLACDDLCRLRQDGERLRAMSDHLLADVGLSRDSLD